MACFRPVSVYKGPDGRIYFDSKKGYADLPLEINCGRCIGCRKMKQAEWAVRMSHEAQMHDRNCFLTLTYSDECLPYGLEAIDIQKFIRSLRKQLKKGPKKFQTLRYFVAGEYTPDHTMRPHWHAAIFGQDFLHDSETWQKYPHKLWVSESITKHWPHGFHTIGALTPESACYIAKYTTKKVYGDAAADHYAGRRPEFTMMSRRPGIGATWFEKFREEVFPEDKLMLGGLNVRTPRYYDTLLNEAERADVRWKRLKWLRENWDEVEHYRLIEREKFAEEKANFFKQNRREGEVQ